MLIVYIISRFCHYLHRKQHTLLDGRNLAGVTLTAHKTALEEKMLRRWRRRRRRCSIAAPQCVHLPIFCNFSDASSCISPPPFGRLHNIQDQAPFFPGASPILIIAKRGPIVDTKHALLQATIHFWTLAATQPASSPYPIFNISVSCKRAVPWKCVS
jgi:hypothetical protein